MYKGAIDDRLAIRERIESFGDAVFRRDTDAWISNWAEDGNWQVPPLGIDLSGRPAIRAAWEQAMSAFAMVCFFAFPAAIEIDDDMATARSYVQEILVAKDGGGVRKVVGTYNDTLVKRDGQWLFSRRVYSVLHDEQT